MGLTPVSLISGVPVQIKAEAETGHALQSELLLKSGRKTYSPRPARGAGELLHCCC